MRIWHGKREKPTPEQLAAEVDKIDLSGMEPKTLQLVLAKFRQLRRAGQLSLATAFEIINTHEGPPELNQWRKNRAEWDLSKFSRTPPSYAQEFLNIPSKTL